MSNRARKNGLDWLPNHQKEAKTEDSGYAGNLESEQGLRSSIHDFDFHSSNGFSPMNLF